MFKRPTSYSIYIISGLLDLFVHLFFNTLKISLPFSCTRSPTERYKRKKREGGYSPKLAWASLGVDIHSYFMNS